MKMLANTGIVVGIVCMVIAIILRLMVKEIVLGLVPSSFLDLSIASFLLTIAINTTSEK